MPSNRFSAYIHGANASALASLAITPSDSSDLPGVIRAVTISTAATLSCVGSDGQTNTTADLLVGAYAISAARIRTTGTTVADITSWV